MMARFQRVLLARFHRLREMHDIESIVGSKLRREVGKPGRPIDNRPQVDNLPHYRLTI